MILIKSGLFGRIKQLLPKESNSIVIVTDNYIRRHYARLLLKDLEKKGRKILLLSFPEGEKFKNIKTVCRLQEAMLKNYYHRESLILAVGGGVVGDIAGFTAATYMRGISYIQIPTTLLAMVDSSIGGKTGINLPQGKNLMGVFFQPKMVISDINFLRTLSKKHIINGLIEVLKIFLVQDSWGFNYLTKNLDKIINCDEKVLIKLVRRAVNLKLNIIKQDERDKNLRAILNFGHTIGHALEKVSDYTLLHGHAVAYGILLEAKISQLMGFLNDENYYTISSVLEKMGFVGKNLKKYDVHKIMKLTLLDKKVKNNNVHYVLLENIGNVHKETLGYTHSISKKLIKKAFSEIIEV